MLATPATRSGVNVHTRSRLADSRWRAKVSDDPRWEPEQLLQLFAQAERNTALWTDPLDPGCSRIEVKTTDGYDPTISEVVAWIHSPAVIPAGVSA